MTVADRTPSPLDSIPPPPLIRDRLARLFTEVRLLRALLRLSESKSRDMASLTGPRADRMEVSRAP